MYDSAVLEPRRGALTTHLRCARALLPGGWARDVHLEIGDDGTLVLVRPGHAPPGGTPTEDVGVCVPGVPNLHSHAFQRAMAGLAEGGSAEGDSFWGWRRRMYHFLARLGPEDVETVATWLQVEMLEAGYTSVGEFHYLHHAPDGRPYDDPADMSRRIVRAARHTGIGLTHLPVLYMTGDFGGAPPEEGQRRFVNDVGSLVRLLETVSADLVDDPDRRTGLALHSLRAVPPEAIGAAVRAADRLDAAAPIHIHVAEQRREVEACLAWSGARPVAWLLDHAPVDERWCLAHATHLDEAEVERAARTGAVAGLCPTTEANLGDGLFELEGWMEAGGSLGVGSDSHVSVSPVEELRWLEYGQRLRTGARNVAAGPDERSTGRVLLEAAVMGGERALRRGAGGLAPGRRADLVVLDDRHPAMAEREEDDLLDAWIFASTTSVVRHVMVGGRWVVRDGRHPGREAAARAYRKALERLA
ncbi:MAG: formimidoylglutamate deiminase [Gemmatimonadota bacterium]|jgi:formimidoylglutamate deiminase